MDDIAIALLDDHEAAERMTKDDHSRDLTKMVPLTLEQLQEMNGEPVWITSVKKDGKIPSRWVLYSGKSESRDREDVYVFATTGGIAQGYKGAAYGKTWLAYAHPPANIAKDNNVSTNAAHIDREAWEPCERCKPEEKPLDRFSGHEFIIDGADIYFYDTDDGWEGEEIKFCPWCGRPLTPEAWAEMEKRLRG